MMETIIVEVVLGSTGEVLEFMIPAHVPLKALLEDLVLLIEQQRPNIAFDKSAIVLFDLDRQSVLSHEWTLSQNGVIDSSRLLIL